MASQPLKTILQSVKPDQSYETMTNSGSAVNASPDKIAVTAKPLIGAAPPVDEFMCASLQAKKSSFMITRVVAKPDGDSLDDLDDVTNTEEMSSVADTTQNRWSSIETVHSPCEYSPRSPVHSALLTQGTGDVSHQRQCQSPSRASSASVSKDVQSRFRIVKVESRKPFLRGRWTCVDFADAPSVAQNGGSSDPQAAGNSPAPLPLFVVDNLQGGYVPAFVYSDGLPVLEHNPFNALTCGNIYDASMGQKQNDINLGGVSSTVSKIVEGMSVADVFPNPDSMTRRPSDFLLSSNATNLLVFQDRSNNPDSSVSTFAIDNKIEQAMDLVKSHLMFAVHEEVELLKEQIKDLMMKNAQLEYENNVLRAAASPETLAILEASIVSPSAGSHLLGQLASSEIS